MLELFKNNTHWILQVLSGGVISGTVSELTGGRFMDGFSSGLITAGLNHAMHSLVEREGGDPPKKGETKFVEGPYGEITVYTYNCKEWVFTRHIPGSGAITPTDSPIEWLISLGKAPLSYTDDLTILYAKNFGNKIVGWGLKQVMNYNDVTKTLKSNRWEYVRQGKGSHVICKSPSGTQQPIPYHGSKSLSSGLINFLNKLK